MTLTVACVGAGYFSQFHYGSWARIDDARLVASCDSDLAKAETTGLPAYASVEVMLGTVTPDILDVILPPAAHASVLRAAIARGVKTIICQKPFCANLVEAREVAAEARAQGVSIVVHENFRFQPWYRLIKSQLDAGAIGQVLQATFRLRPGDGQGAEAYLDRQPYFQKMPRFLVHETAVHWVDTFRYLFGNPTAVYADLRQVNPVISGEDAGVILFDHPGGVRAVFDGNRHLDHAADNLRRTMGEALIEGTKGTLMLMGDGSVHMRSFGETDTICILPPDPHDGFGGDCVHHLQCHVVAGVRYGMQLENLADEYLRVIEIEEAIYASAAAGQKIELDAT